VRGRRRKAFLKKAIKAEWAKAHRISIDWVGRRGLYSKAAGKMKRYIRAGAAHIDHEFEQRARPTHTFA
jgi:hypothetical protein